MSRILVIEDDKNIANALAIRLRAEGYHVSVAFDSVSGLSLGRSCKPDLILLDISMPGGGGFLVAERLRNMAPTSSIPLIFLTANREPGLRDQAMTLGAVDFLEKPYEAKDLLAAIAGAMGEPSPKQRAA